VFSVVTPDAAPLALDHLPNEHALLLANQDLLGPDSLFFGFLPAQWARLQDKYLLFRGLPNQRHEAVTGIKAMVTALLSQVHSTWLLRNEHLHGTDPLQQSSYKRLHLLAQIRELYDAAPLMLVGDRDILAFSFDRRQVQNTETLHTFYVWAKPLVDHSIHVANELGSRFRRIDDYFRPVIPPELCDVIL
jgi:hypothetical protein